MFSKKRSKLTYTSSADLCISGERMRLKREAEQEIEVTEGMDTLKVEDQIKMVRWIARHGLLPKNPPEILQKCIENNIEPEQASAFRYFLEKRDD